MRYSLTLFWLFFCLVMAVLTSQAQDLDYLRLKSEGDQLIQQGDYKTAEKKFLAILEVPGFQLDAYARKQLMDIRRVLEILASIESVADPITRMAGWKQVVEINPSDSKLKRLLSQYYLEEAERKELTGQWGDALELYVLAERYAPEAGFSPLKNELKGQMNLLASGTQVVALGGRALRSPQVPWKIGLGLVSLGSLWVADRFNQQWNEAQLAFQVEEQRALRMEDFGLYNQAFDGLVQERNKRNWRNVSYGVAIAACVGQVGIWVLPKISNRLKAYWQGNSVQVQLRWD